MVRDSEALGGGAGLGADIRLATAQADLVDLLKYTHRVTRIDIAVFGFSRGAALARAFVNRLIQKCEMRDGILHWPCETALDGESAPLHIRFLGLFDTVESVGLPGKNLHPDMWMSIPEQVERCVHHYATHELRSFFPLTPVDAGLKHCEEIAMPGVHSDVGGGYRPDDQGRSDMLARIPLNRMRLEAAIAGVPFTPPLLLTPDVHALFEYSADLKALYDEYMAAIPTHESREAQILAHMRLYYGWLKSRYKTSRAMSIVGAKPRISAAMRRWTGSGSPTPISNAMLLNWRIAPGSPICSAGIPIPIAGIWRCATNTNIARRRC